MKSGRLENPSIYSEQIQKIRYKCPCCGHSVTIPVFVKKQLCDWCNHWVFPDKKDEFLYRLNEQIKKKKRDEKNGTNS